MRSLQFDKTFNKQSRSGQQNHRQSNLRDDERSLVLDQVTNGVAARMAVLFSLLEGDRDA